MAYRRQTFLSASVRRSISMQKNFRAEAIWANLANTQSHDSIAMSRRFALRIKAAWADRKAHDRVCATPELTGSARTPLFPSARAQQCRPCYSGVVR